MRATRAPKRIAKTIWDLSADDLHLDMYLQLKRSPEQDLRGRTICRIAYRQGLPELPQMDYGRGVRTAVWRGFRGHCDRFALAGIARIHRQRRSREQHGDRLLGRRGPGARSAAHGNSRSRRRGQAPLRQHERSANSRRFAAGSDRGRLAPQLPAAPDAREADAIHREPAEHPRRSRRPGDDLQFDSGVFRRVYRPGTDNRRGRGYRSLQRYRRLDRLPRYLGIGSVPLRFAHAGPPGGRRRRHLRRSRSKRRRRRGGHRRRMGQRGCSQCRHRNGILRRYDQLRRIHRPAKHVDQRRPSSQRRQHQLWRVGNRKRSRIQ